MSVEAEAKQALEAWGGSTIVPRLIKNRENAVFEVHLSGGERAALRLHRFGYQSAAAIQSELWWMQEVGKHSVAVPVPIPTDRGNLIHQLGTGRIATAISWVHGKQLGDQGAELGGTLTQQEARFDAIGSLVAQLHNATDLLRLPDSFERHRWDIDGFLGENPFWGRFWENPTLTANEKSLVLRARGQAREILECYAVDGGDFGLIHADVLRENVLFSGSDPVLIDFDDCGFGFRLYDLASLASQNEQEPHYRTLMAASIKGYRRRRELTDEALQLLPMFIMLRRFASCGWVVPREGVDRQRIYAERAARAAKLFLDDV